MGQNMKGYELERYTFYHIVSAFSSDPASAPALFFVGPPGVGKSYITYSAFVRFVKLLVLLYCEKHSNYEFCNNSNIHDEKEDQDLQYLRQLAKVNKNIAQLVDSVPTFFQKAEEAKKYEPKAVSSSVPIIRFDEKIPSHVYQDAAVYVSINMGMATPEQLIGIPRLNKEDFTSDFLAPKWAVALRKAKIGLVNLDEFANASTQTIQSLSYSLVLEKRAGNYFFGKPVIATGNTKQSSSIVTPLPGPLFTGRLEIIEVSVPPVGDWIKFMNRKYGKNWPVVIGVLLNIFSKHGEGHEIGDYNVLSLLQRINTMLAGEMGDIYYPPLNIVKKYSKLTPNPDVHSYPSPRAWEQVSVSVYSLLQPYIMTGTKPPKYIVDVIKRKIENIGLPIFARVVASAIIISPNISDPLQAFKEFVDIRNTAKKIKEIVEGGEELETVAIEFASDVVLKHIGLSMAITMITTGTIEQRREALKIYGEALAKIREARKGVIADSDVPSVYYRVAAIILSNILNAFKSEFVDIQNTIINITTFSKIAKDMLREKLNEKLR